MSNRSGEAAREIPEPMDGWPQKLHVCPECGWTIYSENASGDDQPCEAWLLGDETPEHGPTVPVEVVPALSAPESEASDEQEREDG